ncbi:hypothetical protein ACFPRL_24470 [Pseudoclavibacter helvolus]
MLQTSPVQALAHLSAHVTGLRLPFVCPSIGRNVRRETSVMVKLLRRGTRRRQTARRKRAVVSG